MPDIALRIAAVLFLAVLFVSGGCLHKKTAIPRYDAHSLHEDYLAHRQHAADLEGRVVNISGTVTRLDQSFMRSVYLVLDDRVVVYIRQDQVYRLGELKVGVGDHVTCAGIFGGSSLVAQYTTAAGGAVLVLDNAEVTGVSGSWLPQLPLWR